MASTPIAICGLNHALDQLMSLLNIRCYNAFHGMTVYYTNNEDPQFWLKSNIFLALRRMNTFVLMPYFGMRLVESDGTSPSLRNLEMLEQIKLDGSAGLPKSVKHICYTYCKFLVNVIVLFNVSTYLPIQSMQYIDLYAETLYLRSCLRKLRVQGIVENVLEADFESVHGG